MCQLLVPNSPSSRHRVKETVLKGATGSLMPNCSSPSFPNYAWNHLQQCPTLLWGRQLLISKSGLYDAYKRNSLNRYGFRLPQFLHLLHQSAREYTISKGMDPWSDFWDLGHYFLVTPLTSFEIILPTLQLCRQTHKNVWSCFNQGPQDLQVLYHTVTSLPPCLDPENVYRSL